MNRRLALLAASGALAAAAACDSDALSAHADVVAKAGSLSLSVDRLGNLIGESQAPVRKDVARSIADMWVDYQLLGKAAAANDSLGDLKLVDEAMEPLLQRARIEKLYADVSKPWRDKPVDTAGLEARFNQGEFLSARHILLPVTQGSTAETLRKTEGEARDILRQANASNFAALATKYSKDPGSATRGGDLGVFPRGVMVPDFERGLLALKPGEISNLVRTPYGFHIIRRSAYADVKAQVVKAAGDRAAAQAESTYLAKLETDARIDVRNDAVLTVKAVAIDLEAHLTDKSVIASMEGEDYTAAKLARLLRTIPQKAQLVTQLQSAPDSVISSQFLKPVLRTELLVHQADEKKIQLDTSYINNVRRSFFGLVHGAWNGLGIAPAMLADSANKNATAEQRERKASDKVEAYFDKLIKQETQFVEIPPPLEMALRQKFSYAISKAGIDRAVEKAVKVRAAADSARTRNIPQSAVPMPDGAASSPATPPAAAPARSAGTRKP
ncbi:MAG: peptidylprolyl isomerase [Gemmatimonadetes bacterium]|nr:peptidylprolyl isomerase [Gemmatimonadota bacterium]